MKTFVKLAAFAVSTTLISSGAMAATATGTMEVTAKVTRTCTVSAGALGFPTIASATSEVIAQSAVSVSCTAGSATDAPTLTVSAGGNTGTTVGALRNLKGGDSGTALVPYTLSSTAGGVNLAPTDTVATAKNTDGTQYSATVHGKIAAGTYQKGNYADTVTVTLTYVAE